MKTADFHFDLPPELIAQTPIERRDASKMLILNKNDGALSHRHFYDLPDFLKPGDCLVLNDSRVLPARLIGRREDGGHAVELVLLTDKGNNVWECLVRPGKKCRPGNRLVFGENEELKAEITDENPGGTRLVRFEYSGIFLELLEHLGRMPLPPYIRERLEDPERYQTVYSRVTGSAAAPTAGLHFTDDILDRIRAKGVATAFLTLHVGLGTFRPVKETELEEHLMHSEYYTVSEETAKMINDARKAGGRIISVGTTSCRTLETIADTDGTIHATSGWTDIYIYPGYTFKGIDGLITNFHLPESTLIMLVSAFAGREHVLNAYRIAIEERYRFFSFGDCMLII